MQLQGKIKAIMPVKETATFKSIEVIITTDFDTTYPQHLSVQFYQGKTSLIEGFKVGDLVTAEVNLKGKEWTNPLGETKYFNSIEVWKLTKN